MEKTTIYILNRRFSTFFLILLFFPLMSKINSSQKEIDELFRILDFDDDSKISSDGEKILS